MMQKNINIQSQNGFALIASLVILVVLTIAGVSASDMNSVQMIMARNHQYYTEAFYTAYSEIDAQIATIRNYDGDGKLPPPLRNLEENGVPEDQVLVLNFAQDLFTLEKNQLSNVRTCIYAGGTIGEGSGGTGRNICKTYEINTSVSVDNSSIGSDQRQEFDYVTPK